MYYIYEYVDPETNEPFYIGKGKKSRMFDHLKETIETTDNRRKFFKIQSLKNKGLVPIINIIVDNIEDEQEAYRIEDEYILKYGRKDIEEHGILLNVCINARPPTLKGNLNGMFNKRHTMEAKQAVSRANKGKLAWNKGVARSQEVKDSISSANKGKPAWNKNKPRSVEEKEKMREGWKKKLSEGFIQHNKGQKMLKNCICENCGIEVTVQNYTRWHGIKCRKA